MPSIRWNPQVKFVISDVDDTIAGVYLPATPTMITSLQEVLQEGVALFLISGQGSEGIHERVVSFIDPKLRQKIILGTCSGAEVWGYQENGELMNDPYYSLYDERLLVAQQVRFREIIEQIIQEFKLIKYPTMPRTVFREKTEGNPLAIAYADRRSQITFEVKNAINLTEEQVRELGMSIPLTHGQYDFRIPILERAEVLFKESGVPIVPRLGGTTAIDFALEGVSKTTAVTYVMENSALLSRLGLSIEELRFNAAEYIEIWGDKFSKVDGGTDRHICEALPKEVRAIDFRPEDPAEFLEGYRIEIWDGEKQLFDGLSEYLQERK